MEKYNKLLRNITELIEKGLFSSKDLKKDVEDSLNLKMQIIANKLNLVSREEFEVQKKLDRSNALLAQGQMNIAELDSRLAATGTDVSQTLQDLKDQVGTNFSEIDKLWAVSYRQNKPDIQKNVRSIKTLKDDLGQSVTNMAGSVEEMSKQYKDLVDEYSGLRDGLLRDNQEFITEIAFLRSQVQDQAVVQEANQRALNTVSRQLKEVNEAISSIDQHRQQLAQKLSQQQTQIQGIQARATNGTDG